MRYKSVFAIAGTLPIILLAFINGSPTKRTGGVDGGQDCSVCHNTFGPANSDSRGGVTIENLKDYRPGVQQLLTVTIKHPEARRWGFQMTARFVNGGGTLKAGYFQPADQSTKVVCDDGSDLGSPGPCRSDQLEWIEHAQAHDTQPGAGTDSFVVTWQPPADENGDVTFYVSAVAADGANNVQNDRVYTTSVRVPLAADSQCGITSAPVIRSAVNAGPHTGAFSPNSMVEIYGTNFQSGSRKRQAGFGDLVNGAFPTKLSCIAVEIGGKRAPVTYVQQDQINVQAPSDVTGPVNVVVIANPGQNEFRSATLPATIQSVTPTFFTFGASKSIAARDAQTGNVIARPDVVAGAQPAKANQWITLYGTGFGPTDPAWQSGQIPTAAARVAGTNSLIIGGQTVPIDYIGLSPGSISGLYQINVQVPAGIPGGDQPVAAIIGGVRTQDGAFIPIQN